MRDKRLDSDWSDIYLCFLTSSTNCVTRPFLIYQGTPRLTASSQRLYREYKKQLSGLPALSSRLALREANHTGATWVSNANAQFLESLMSVPKSTSLSKTKNAHEISTIWPCLATTDQDGERARPKASICQTRWPRELELLNRALFSLNPSLLKSRGVSFVSISNAKPGPNA